MTQILDIDREINMVGNWIEFQAIALPNPELKKAFETIKAAVTRAKEATSETENQQSNNETRALATALF